MVVSLASRGGERRGEEIRPMTRLGGEEIRAIVACSHGGSVLRRDDGRRGNGAARKT